MIMSTSLSFSTRIMFSSISIWKIALNGRNIPQKGYDLLYSRFFSERWDEREEGECGSLHHLYNIGIAVRRMLQINYRLSTSIVNGESLDRLNRLDRDFTDMLTAVKVQIWLQRVLASQCLLRTAIMWIPMVVIGSVVWQLTISTLQWRWLEVEEEESWHAVIYVSRKGVSPQHQDWHS